jgi:predicted DCC family thiol-disulfide oxidoreductase YuxK
MKQAKDVLYYDGQCPLCNAEMAKLRQCADDRIELQDVHQVPDDPALPSREQLLRSLHLRSAAGGMISGLDANVAAWQHTRYGWLWRVLRWPLVKPVADRLYQFWAGIRYRRLYGSDKQP